MSHSLCNQPDDVHATASMPTDELPRPPEISDGFLFVKERDDATPCMPDGRTDGQMVEASPSERASEVIKL